MKYKIVLLIFTCLSACLFGQTNRGKDLVFRIKTAETTVKIFPDIDTISGGASRAITIRIRPVGRKIGEITFRGGTIIGQDSSYVLTAGSGTEGILSVYEKTTAGNKLIMTKVYSFKKTIVQGHPKKGKSIWRVHRHGDPY